MIFVFTKDDESHWKNIGNQVHSKLEHEECVSLNELILHHALEQQLLFDVRSKEIVVGSKEVSNLYVVKFNKGLLCL